MPDSVDKASRIIHTDLKSQQQGARAGTSSVYSCSDCGGVLRQLAGDEVPEFECHTGHHFAAEARAAAQTRMLAQAMSEAVRGFREKAILLRQLAVKANPHSSTTGYLIEQADQHDEHARLLQTLLEANGGGVAASIDMSEQAIADLVDELRRPPDD